MAIRGTLRQSATCGAECWVGMISTAGGAAAYFAAALQSKIDAQAGQASAQAGQPSAPEGAAKPMGSTTEEGSTSESRPAAEIGHSNMSRRHVAYTVPNPHDLQQPRASVLHHTCTALRHHSACSRHCKHSCRPAAQQASPASPNHLRTCPCIAHGLESVRVGPQQVLL